MKNKLYSLIKEKSLNINYSILIVMLILSIASLHFSSLVVPVLCFMCGILTAEAIHYRSALNKMIKGDRQIGYDMTAERFDYISFGLGLAIFVIIAFNGYAVPLAIFLVMRYYDIQMMKD